MLPQLLDDLGARKLHRSTRQPRGTLGSAFPTMGKTYLALTAQLGERVAQIEGLLEAAARPTL